MTLVPPGEFLRLKTGEAIAKIGRTVLPLSTYLLPKDYDPSRVQQIITRSRKNYGKGGDEGSGWSVQPKQPPKLPPPNNGTKNKGDDIDPQRVF